MPRKLYPSEARKIRAMLGEDFTDIEISRALHVAQSTVTNFRNGDQVDSESKNQGQISSDNLDQESEHDKSLTDSEIDREVGISEDIVRNYRGGEPAGPDPGIHPTGEGSEKPEGSTGNPESTGIKFVGGNKHIRIKSKEEYEYECGHCGYEFNEILEKCPKCGYELTLKTEKPDEYVYECGNCGHEFNERIDTCPKCGYTLSL